MKAGESGSRDATRRSPSWRPRGVKYTILVQDFKSYTFSSWAGGAKNQGISIVPYQDTVLCVYVENQTNAKGSNMPTGPPGFLPVPRA